MASNSKKTSVSEYNRADTYETDHTIHKRRSPEHSDVNKEDLYRGKKQRVHGDQTYKLTTSCQQIASVVRGLTDIVTQLNSLKTNRGEDFTQILKEVSDRVPMVVVFGAQSAGKSSLIKKMFDISSKIGTGCATRIPIEYRFGPNQDKCDSVCFVKGQQTVQYERLNEGKTLNECITDFEKVLDQHNASFESYPDLKIVCNLHRDESLTIVDLPGVVTTNSNGDDNQKIDNYFEFLRQSYLNPKNSIVLHVTRGDSDPSADPANRYVTECKNRICVLTNADVWKSHPDKLGYLNGQLRKNPYKIAAVSNADINQDEIFRLIDSKFATNANDFIIGHEPLKKEILEEVADRSAKLFPEIRQYLIILGQHVANFVELFGGRTTPDMRDVCHRFRQAAQHCIEGLVHKPECNAVYRSMRDAVSVQSMRQFKTFVPSPNELAIEIRDSNRASIEGAEGWDSVAKHYIKIMANELYEILVSSTNKYCRQYESDLIKVLDDLPQRFYQSTKFIQSSKDRLREIIDDERKNQNESTRRFLDEFVLKPYAPVTNNYITEMDKQSCEHTSEYYQKKIKDFLKQRNRYDVQDVEVFLTGLKTGLSDVYRCIEISRKNEDRYLRVGKTAKETTEQLWDSYSEEIHAKQIRMYEQMMKNIENRIVSHITSCESTDMVEDSSKENERKNLCLLENTVYRVKEDLDVIIQNAC